MVLILMYLNGKILISIYLQVIYMFKRIVSVFMIALLLIMAIPELIPEAEAASASTYYITVDIANQVTTVYRKSDMSVVRQMICSTGTGNRTPRGTFKLAKTRKSTDRKAWYHISSNCYVKYATRITGPYLFHSILYSKKNMNSVDQTSLRKLGSKASHGCVRLYWEDAKWIAENCPPGTVVKIYSNGKVNSTMKKRLKTEGYIASCGLAYSDFMASDYKTSQEDALGRGASGEKVTALQNRLQQLGFMSGSISGKYDNATIAAVLRYQRANGETATGIVTSELYDYILNNDNVLGNYSTFSENMSGPVILKLQKTLKAIGFYSGETDGVFSSEFAQAVNMFCVGTGRSASKVATPEIQDAATKLLEDLNDKFGEGQFDILIKTNKVSDVYVNRSSTYLRKKASSSSTNLKTVKKNARVTVVKKGKPWTKVKYGGKTGYIYTSHLTFGSASKYTAYWGYKIDSAQTAELSSVCFGNGVVELQRQLKERGFYPDGDNELYDNATIKAVMAYQQAAGYEATGIASIELQNEIFDPGNPITGTLTSLSKGSSSLPVRAMQDMLIAMGYQEGEASGVFDDATVSAVKLFTKANRLGETATATTAVQNAILNQYLDCESKYGTGNYKVSVSSTSTKMVSSNRKQTLYKKASSGSKKLTTINKGKKAVLISKGKKYSKVKYGSKVGYLRTSYLKFYTQVDWFVEFNAPTALAANVMVYGDEVDTCATSESENDLVMTVGEGLVAETGSDNSLLSPEDTNESADESTNVITVPGSSDVNDLNETGAEENNSPENLEPTGVSAPESNVSPEIEPVLDAAA